MSDQYVGEIRMFSGTYEPRGWLFCDGRLLPIANHEPLFSLLGTTWGGDGRTQFKIPDLRTRLPVCSGAGPGLTPRIIGASGGVDAVEIREENMPAHNHRLMASTAPATESAPSSTLVYAAAASADPGALKGLAYVADATGLTPRKLKEDVVGEACGLPSGLTATHQNTMPTLAIRFIIAESGLFPVPE